MAVVQLRRDTEGRAYHRRKLAAGKTPMEAVRCLKRRLSDIVYRQTVGDAERLQTGPGGHTGATLQSSAADPNPRIDTSELGESFRYVGDPGVYSVRRVPDGVDETVLQ